MPSKSVCYTSLTELLLRVPLGAYPVHHVLATGAGLGLEKQQHAELVSVPGCLHFLRQVTEGLREKVVTSTWCCLLTPGSAAWGTGKGARRASCVQDSLHRQKQQGRKRGLPFFGARMGFRSEHNYDPRQTRDKLGANGAVPPCSSQAAAAPPSRHRHGLLPVVSC